MLRVALAMSLVLFAWSVSTVFLVGLGLLFRRIFVRAPRYAGDWLGCVWAGYATVIVFLQIWHLVLPVSWQAGVVLAGLSGFGLYLHRRPLLDGVRRLPTAPLITLALAMLVVVFLSNLAIGMCRNGDTGLYHVNSILWLKAYAIVPGLGNLHNRLAGNHAHFLYCALWECCGWHHRSFHVVNGTLVVPLILQVMLSVRRLCISAGACRLRDGYLGFMALPILMLAAHDELTHLSPDLPVFVLGVVIAALLLDLADTPSFNARERRYRFFLGVYLCSVTVAVKLSFVAQGATAVLVGFILYAFMGPDRPDRRRLVAAMALPAAVVLVPWAIRGIIWSGYIAFPVAVGWPDLDWAMPRGAVTGYADIVKGWARQPGGRYHESLAGFRWVPAWWQRRIAGDGWILISVVLCGLIGGAGALIASCRHLFHWHRSVEGDRVRLIQIPWLMGIAFWFLTAPDPRFAGSTFWVFAAIGFIAMVCDRRQPISSVVRCRAAQAYILVSVAVMFWWGWRVDMIYPVDPGFSRIVFTRPGSDPLGFYPKAPPSRRMTTFRTQSGLELTIPLPRKKVSSKPWYGSLLWTQWPNDQLRLRDPNNIQCGFTVKPPRYRGQLPCSAEP